MRDAARTCTIGGLFGSGPVRIQTQLRLKRPRKHRGYHLNQSALDHMHIAGPNQWPAEQGRVEPRRPRVTQYMFVPVESRAGSGSARSRLPDEESPSRPRAKLLVKEWHAEKQNVGEADLDARGRQVVLYRLADICTALTRQYRGAVGDVARALGGSLVAPPVDALNTQRYFGDLKGFGAINDLTTLVTKEVPVKAAPVGGRLDRALRYGNHRSAAEHLPAIWEKLGEDVRRQKCLVIEKSAAHEIHKLRVPPLGAVVTHKVRIIKTSFLPRRRAKEKKEDSTETQTRTPSPNVRRSTTKLPHGTNQPQKKISGPAHTGE